MCALTAYSVGSVALLGDTDRPGGVTFAFTERAGGVSEGAYASLNLGDSCGDIPAHVAENRRRALAALSPAACIDCLVNPRQVHGDKVVRIVSGSPEAIAAARAEARAGADAVAVCAPGVPVLLCYADCVPIVICAPGGFAVVHSGWKGTYARIAGKAVAALAAITGAHPKTMSADVGPHILGEEYEVSRDLAEKFAETFGRRAIVGERNLDLSACIASTLAEAGLDTARIVDERISTAANPGRFFSYRASGGTCGRHGALAVMEG